MSKSSRLLALIFPCESLMKYSSYCWAGSDRPGIAVHKDVYPPELRPRDSVLGMSLSVYIYRD